MTLGIQTVQAYNQIKREVLSVNRIIKLTESLEIQVYSMARAFIYTVLSLFSSTVLHLMSVSAGFEKNQYFRKSPL